MLIPGAVTKDYWSERQTVLKTRRGYKLVVIYTAGVFCVYAFGEYNCELEIVHNHNGMPVVVD